MAKRFVVVAVMAGFASQANGQFEGMCAQGAAINERGGWEWIENNARRAADEHAVAFNPAATYIRARVEPNYQFAGDHAGGYLVMVRTETSPIAFAVLKPNFDFCSDPRALDDSREDLFEVVSAKLDGRDYYVATP